MKRAGAWRLRDWLDARLPLAGAAAVWVLGLALVRSDVLPVVPAAMLLAATGLLLLLSGRRGLCLLLLAAAMLGALFLLHLARQYDIPADWLQRPVALEADVAEVEIRPGYQLLLLEHVRPSADADLEQPGGGELAGRLRVYLHGGPRLQAGDRIALRVRLHRPENDRNPGAFDYRRWCFDHGIAAIGRALDAPRLLARHPGMLQRLRDRLRQAILTRPASGPDVRPDASGAILQALLLADRSAIPASTYDAFSASGAAHLLAISGMHVGMAAAVFFGLAWWLLTRFEACMVYLPVRSLALLAGLFGAGFYAMLAGWPWPAMRAGLMLAAAVLAWLLRARSFPLNTLLAALMLLLALDASAVVSLSLWMSFTASAAVLIWAEGHELRDQGVAASGARRLSGGLFWISLVAGLATLPLVASVFGRLPVYGLPLNLLLVPLYGVWVLPTALAGEIGTILGLDTLAGACLSASAAGIDAGLWLIHRVTSWPLGRLWLPEPGMPALLAFTAGMLIAAWLWVGRRHGRGALVSLLAGLLLFLLLSLPEYRPAAPQWIVWDVGQGASSSLLLPDGEVIVVDVPGRAGQRFDGGTRVAAGLRHLGITHADVLVLTHAQADHMGGASSLLRGLNRLGEVWLPDVPANRSHARLQSFLAEAEKRGVRIRWLAKGEHIERNGLSLRVLWPPRRQRLAHANDDSLVLELTLANGARLLLPGDIERDAEARLEGLRPVQAMLMPHHGSRSSSSPALLERLHPDIAIAQSGRRNRFGFPDPAVVRRYRALGCRVFNTAEGAVQLSWEADSGPPEIRRWPGPSSSRQDLALQWRQRLL